MLRLSYPHQGIINTLWGKKNMFSETPFSSSMHFKKVLSNFFSFYSIEGIYCHVLLFSVSDTRISKSAQLQKHDHIWSSVLLEGLFKDCWITKFAYLQLNQQWDFKKLLWIVSFFCLVQDQITVMEEVIFMYYQLLGMCCILKTASCHSTKHGKMPGVLALSINLAGVTS